MSIQPDALARPCQACNADPGEPCTPACLAEAAADDETAAAAAAACPICSTGGLCDGCDVCEAHEDQPCEPWCEYAEDDTYEDGPETPSPYEEPIPPGW